MFSSAAAVSSPTSESSAVKRDPDAAASPPCGGPCFRGRCDGVVLRAVVKIALEPPPLRILSSHQPPSGSPQLLQSLLQLRGKAGIVKHQSGLRREICETAHLSA